MAATIRLKLIREVRQQWLQIVSIGLVMACGVMTIMGLRGTLRSIRSARDHYYSDYRFADVFVQVQRAPTGLASRIARMPGVAAVETRIVKDIKLDVPGLVEPAVGHVVSIPAEQRAMLNQVLVRRGRYITPGREEEILLGERFAEINRIAPGDTIAGVINGRWRKLHVVGLAISPEFVVEMAAGGLFLDHHRYGVIWANADLLSVAFNMSGAFNDAVIRLASSDACVRVIRELDALLAPWGSAGAYAQKDQAAARVLEDEFTQLRTNANMFPMFFLVVAAFLLNIVLSRLVASQRDEIAALKAFGYTDGEVGWHYLGFGLAALAVGAGIGVPAGLWMSTKFTLLYAEYFRFPSVPAIVDWPAALIAVSVTGTCALLGAWFGVRRVMKLAPADALRPEAPRTYRQLALQRLGLDRWLTPGVRVVLRNIERRPVRTLSTLIGVAMAVALLASGQFPYDALDELIEKQFTEAQPASAVVAFAGDRMPGSESDLRHVTGVVEVEPFRSVPVRLRRAATSRTTAITGIRPDATLFRTIDAQGNRHAMPNAGAVRSKGLADDFAVRVGDTLTVELLQRGGETRKLGIVGIFQPMIGQGMYMSTAALNRLMTDDGVLSGAYVGIQTGNEDSVTAKLKTLPGVTGVQTRRATLRNIDEQMRDSMSFALTLIITSACLIAVGVVYNSARIALAERERELATLRVLGFSVGEVTAMIFGEQFVLIIAALPLGVALGAVFDYLLALGFSSDRFQFPLVFEWSSQIVAMLVVIVAGTMTGLAVRRRVDGLDLVGALRTRE